MCLVGGMLSPASVATAQIPPFDSLPPGVTPAMVERGRVVFEGPGLCANCHGPLAGGMLGPNLTDSEWWHAQGSYLAIVQQILTGVPIEQSSVGTAMPPKGGTDISDAEVQSVAAYVWKLSHPHAGDSLPVGVTPDMVERGHELFSGRANCATCHGADATGLVGPDLTDEDWLHAKGSYLSIVQQILLGVPQDQSRSGLTMLPRGGSRITDADVHAVAAYVWSLSRRR